MATLDDLEISGILSRYKHSYPAITGRGRKMWFYSEAAKWLVKDFCAMEPFYADSLAPKKQAAVLLKNFVTGVEFEPRINFWHMRPHKDDIYELKTADLRIFGWFYRPRVFVAALAATFEETHDVPGVHAKYRDDVIKMRDDLDLEPPKWVVGAEAKDVF